MNLWQSLLAPPMRGARLKVWEDGGFREEPWDAVVAAAERAAAGLRDRGVRPGDRVACVLTNSFDVCAGLLGIWLAGGVVASLPTPARGMAPDAYLAQLESLCAAAGTSQLLVEDAFAAAAPAGGALRFTGFGALGQGGGRLEPDLAGPDEPCFVQYSSGSTSRPKGCVLTPRAIGAQLDMLSERIGIDPERDTGYSWLPLSHDMGLFGGLLIAWSAGTPLTLGTPLRFLRAPRTWLEDCAESGATVTVGPNFGLALSLRALRRATPAERLRLRTLILGSDQVEAALLADAAAALEPLGVPSSALTPAYGMAEATLAVTMTARDADPSGVPIALDALYAGAARPPAPGEHTTRITSCGPPMAGAEVRIDGPDDVGEIVVRSPALAQGYLGEPERTARTFRGGELHTGDLGFVRDGELYVIGRADDMLSIGGRNIHAGEVESRLCRDHAIRAGSCVLVDVHEGGRQRLVVLSEPAVEEFDFATTAHAMRRTAASATGVGINECIFVERGALPKSPSGKIQRFRCRALANGGGPVLARIHVG